VKEKLTWLHISDIHFHSKTEWRDSSTRNALLTHLKSTFDADPALRPDFIFCTGDIAFGDSSATPISNQFEQAKTFFDELLATCGDGSPMPKERLFVVPGNHDVNRNIINSDAQKTLITMAQNANEHIEIINQRFNDKSREFDDAIKRLDDYAAFVADYLPHQKDKNGRHHFATISDVGELKVGIAGFNSAWTCAGPEDERHIWLAASWQFNMAQQSLIDADIRIGLMHHPIDWLNSVEHDFAEKQISSEFDFWLHGHIHNAWVSPIQSHIVVAAGAVGAATNNEFGINIVCLNLASSRGAVHLFNAKPASNRWAIAPIPPHAPVGKWEFDLPSNLRKYKTVLPSAEKNKSMSDELNRTEHILTQRLEAALHAFSDQPVVWISPTLKKSPETIKESKDEPKKINLGDFIANPKSTIIKAPAQHGLTCLAHFLAKEAWSAHQPSLWIYLDAKLLKPNNASFEDAIALELETLRCGKENIKCIILDSWRTQEKDAIKLLTKLSERFKELPIICMQQIDIGLSNPNETSTHGRQFDVLYLWALPRNEVRQIVAAYNDAKYIGEEDAVTTRIVSDLEMFNLHRTAFNCLTLLKAYEASFVESPINRSEMINRVLFQLFNSYNIPTYQTRPDLQDCEYVIGYFCELLIRDDEYIFPRSRFLLEIQNICKAQLIELETQVVFDVLYENNIIISQGAFFCFRFSFWIYYFAAHRMHHDKTFAGFMLENMRYAKYPELCSSRTKHV